MVVVVMRCSSYGRGERRTRWTRGAALLGLLALATCYGPEIARIELGDIGKSGESKVELKQGTRLEFGLTTDSYEYSGASSVLLDVVLLKDGAAVGDTSCESYRQKGGTGCGSGMSAYYGCRMTVPAGGANTIRASTRLQGSGTMSFSNLAIKVHRDE
jgi:hypothetical protein